MSNKYGKDLIERVDERFSVDSLSMSMSEWITKNTTLKGKPFSFKGYEFQRQIVDDMHPNMNVIKISQVGLALDLATLIPTSSGWTTMGDIRIGEEVYDENGRICTVTYTSPTYLDRKCYEVKFDDGSKIITDEEHKWFVKSERKFHPTKGAYRGRGRIPKKDETEYVREGIITTGVMAKKYKSGSHNTFYIPVTKPIEGRTENLDINPYYLGLWLGDGHSYSTRITSSYEDAVFVKASLLERGFEITDVSKKPPTVEMKVDLSGSKQTLYNKLSKLNLLQNKHIPLEYLKSSVETRMELLRGLMDADGSITGGRCSFHNTNTTLIRNVEELLASLGLKYHTRWRPPSKAAFYKGQSIIARLPIAEIGFVTYKDFPVFNLPRKREKLLDREEGRPTECSRRRIVSIIEVPTRPVRCIQVNSESHLYLAGESMIATHNTEVQIRKALGFLIRNRGTSAIFSLPNQDMYERISNSRVKPIVDKDKVFNTAYDRLNKATRSMAMKQFGDSFLYLVPAIESAATSIDADAVFNDEVDLSDPEMIALFNSRLQGSKFRITQKFSTPTFPAHGVDALWQSSDKHHYMVRCGCCGHWCYPEFTRDFIHLPGAPDNLALTDIVQEMQDDLDFVNCYVKCNKCHKPLDLADPALREWVPKYPHRTQSRGYCINPFISASLDIPYIYKSLWTFLGADNRRGFFNTVLGQPYTDGSIQIQEEDIKACMTAQTLQPDLSSFESLFVGIDVGQICHITIGDQYQNVVAAYTVHVDQLVSHVEKLCKDHKVRAGCIDRHPYEPTADAVFRVSGGKIMPTEYRGSKDVNIVTNQYEEVTHAQVNRTWMLDALASRIKNRKMQISGYGVFKEVLITHLRNMVRDETPEKEAVWTKLNNDDHYFHSMAFMNASLEVMNIARLKLKEDIRTIAFGFVVGSKDNTANLVGVSGKRVDPVLLKS